MLAVFKHAVDDIFFFQHHNELARMCAQCVQQSSVAAVQNFISSTAIAPSAQQ